MCLICRYNQKQDIDRALLSGATPASLHKKYSFSIPALQRHQKHLVEKVHRAQQRLRDHLRQNCLFKLNRVLEIAMHTARLASGAGDARTALQATREVTRIIALMTKLDFELDPEMVYCLLGSHGWVGYHGILPTESEAIPKIRASMGWDLFAPCPQPDPALDSPPDPQSPELDPFSTSAPETPASQVHTPVPPAVGPPAVDRKLKTTKGRASEKAARQQREISAKK